MNRYTGVPTQGRQCYEVYKTGARYELATRVGDLHFVAVKPERFTNVDLRVTLDVWEGEILV